MRECYPDLFVAVNFEEEVQFKWWRIVTSRCLGAYNLFHFMIIDQFVAILGFRHGVLEAPPRRVMTLKGACFGWATRRVFPLKKVC